MGGGERAEDLLSLKSGPRLGGMVAGQLGVGFCAGGPAGQGRVALRVGIVSPGGWEAALYLELGLCGLRSTAT